MLKKNEKGRSMIEMLGVLAIIGVLSVGGIYGYKVAMSKHKANEVAQLVSMVGVDMETTGAIKSQAGMSLDLPPNSPATITLKNYENGGTTYQNAAIEVDFGDDVDTCKHFAQLYGGANSNFAISAKCEE